MIQQRTAFLDRGLIALLLLLLSAVAMAPSQATAQSSVLPPPLAGSYLQGFLDQVTFDGPAPCTAFSGQVSATLPFQASGVSVGAYPGTFTANGSATVTTNPVGGNTVMDFHFTFRINSPVGQVEGTATLDPTMPSQGFCGTGANDPRFGSGFYFQVSLAYLKYEATITTVDGTFQDSGDLNANIYAFSGDENTCLGQQDGLSGLGGTTCGSFGAQFTRSDGVTEVPTSGDDDDGDDGGDDDDDDDDD